MRRWISKIRSALCLVPFLLLVSAADEDCLAILGSQGFTLAQRFSSIRQLAELAYKELGGPNADGLMTGIEADGFLYRGAFETKVKPLLELIHEKMRKITNDGFDVDNLLGLTKELQFNAEQLGIKGADVHLKTAQSLIDAPDRWDGASSNWIRQRISGSLQNLMTQSDLVLVALGRRNQQRAAAAGVSWAQQPAGVARQLWFVKDACDVAYKLLGGPNPDGQMSGIDAGALLRSEIYQVQVRLQLTMIRDTLRVLENQGVTTSQVIPSTEGLRFLAQQLGIKDTYPLLAISEKIIDAPSHWDGVSENWIRQQVSLYLREVAGSIDQTLSF